MPITATLPILSHPWIIFVLKKSCQKPSEVKFYSNIKKRLAGSFQAVGIIYADLMVLRQLFFANSIFNFINCDN